MSAALAAQGEILAAKSSVQHSVFHGGLRTRID